MTRQQQNNDHPEENGASQEDATYQSSRNGREQYTLSPYRAATMPVLLQHFDEESENLQAMQARTEEHIYAIAARLHKAKLTVHGLKELALTITEAHKGAKITNRATETQVAGTPVYNEVVEFDREVEAMLRGQYRDLLGVVGHGCIRDAGKTPKKVPPKKEEKKGGGLFGWTSSKEKVIIERVPMDRPGSIVPPEENLFADLDV